MNDMTGVAHDDFAEFLNSAYASLLDALTADGLTVRIDKERPTAYALVVESSDGRRLDVTASGRPLPASPLDVSQWDLVVGKAVTVLPGTLPLSEVARRITALLAAT